MTPQELKNSILQLAIQGKLVEQRPEEGTAAELLEKILSTKNAKSAKKNLTRSRGARGGKTPDLIEIAEGKASFEIPESWGWAELGVCCEMYTGNSISEVEKRTKYEGRKEGLDYIGTKDVSFQQTICYNNGVKIPFDKEVDFRKARAGAILLCIEGGSAGKKIAILDRDVCFGNKLCMFMPRTLLNTYLFFFLQSMEFRKVFSENMTGIIGGVSIKKLKEIMVPIPPLAEQKRIVAKIEELLPLIDRYEKAWSKLEDFNKRFPVDMQKSLLQMAIQGKLVEQRAEEGTGEELLEKIFAAKNAKGAKKNLTRSRGVRGEKKTSALSASPLEEISDDEKPFDIPEGWKWARLEDISESVNVGIVIRPKRYYVPKGEGTPAFRNCNIQQGFINAREWVYLSQDAARDNPRAVVKSGDILIARSGTPGNCCVVTESFDGWGAIDIVIVRLRKKLASPQYIKTFICAPSTQKAFLYMSRGVALSHLGATTVASLLLPLPPLAEQKRIVAKLEELLPLCERLKSPSISSSKP